MDCWSDRIPPLCVDRIPHRTVSYRRATNNTDHAHSRRSKVKKRVGCHRTERFLCQIPCRIGNGMCHRRRSIHHPPGTKSTGSGPRQRRLRDKSWNGGTCYWHSRQTNRWVRRCRVAETGASRLGSENFFHQRYYCHDSCNPTRVPVLYYQGARGTSPPPPLSPFLWW